MPLTTVEELSDAGSAGSPVLPATPPAKKKGNQKGKDGKQNVSTKEADAGKKPKPKATVKAKPKSVLKKPAAAPMRRPAASESGLPTKVNKYWYAREQKIGIKVDGREVTTARTSVINQVKKSLRLCVNLR